MEDDFPPPEAASEAAGSALARSSTDAGRFVRGYTQQVDDRDELFASTPSLTTLKLLLTLSSAFSWHIATGDVSTSFSCTPLLKVKFMSSHLWSTTRKEMCSGS